MVFVDDLLKLVGLTDADRRVFDWETVERGLGLTLPADYKEVAERFPDGRFQGFITPIRPGDVAEKETDFLGYYARRLADMRRWRADEPERFPYPLYPEPGGLLPWATTHRADLIFWQSDTWSIVASDSEFEVWEEIPGTVCDFLTDVVSGRYDARRYGIDLAARGPSFDEPSAPEPPPTGAQFWLDFQLWPEILPNEFAAVADLLGPGEGVQVDWTLAEQAVGLVFPADYRQFVESYGTGLFGDLTIAAPGAAVDLYELAADTYHRLVDELLPVFPEPGGLVPWGTTPDGWICGWARSHDDPDRWGTVRVEPASGCLEYACDQSFSSFLVRYADPRSSDLFIGREMSRPERIVWVPTMA
jgi:hypothetical protein